MRTNLNILRVTIVWLIIAVLVQFIPNRHITVLDDVFDTVVQGQKVDFITNGISDEIDVLDTIEYTTQSDNAVSVQQVDLFNLIPYSNISDVEIDMLNEYIKSTLAYGNYTICTLIEYSRDEENNSNCYHFTWDDLRYTCIYITEGHNVPLLLYDVEITDDIVQHWDTI